MALIKVSTVEIVNASPRMIIVNDKISVCPFNNKLKKPKYMMESFSCKRNFILEEPEGWLSVINF